MLEFTVHTEGMEEAIKKIKDSSSYAEIAVAEDVERLTRPFVPALTLSQANKGHVHMFDKATRESEAARRSGKSVVIYPGPYARYLYYGKVMKGPLHGPKYETNKKLVYTKSTHPQAQEKWFEASKAQNLDAWLKTADKAVIHYLKRK